MDLTRGDVAIADFDPTLGSEQAGTRPCVVVQNDAGNQHAPTTIVLPCTTSFTDRLYPFEAFLPADDTPLSEDSVAMANQITTVDVDERVRATLGPIPDYCMDDVEAAIEYSLGLRAV